MEPPELARALAAAKSAAAALGFDAAEAAVVQNSNKVSARLLPCDVLARVSAEGHNVAPLEVDIAARLAAAGAPVAALADPRPHVRDGFVVTLWTYYPPQNPPDVVPAAYGEALHRLHAAMRPLAVPTPHFMDRVAEAQQIVQTSPALTRADRDLLDGVLTRLTRSVIARDAVEQLLHGEPHPGNLLATAGGPVFIDLETCCRGPVEFDLAHAPEAVAAHYPGADLALLNDCRALVLAMVAAWRYYPGDQFPNRERAAYELLSALRQGPPWPALDVINARMAAAP